MLKCIKDTYSSRGIRGFYRGITASYYGIAETVVHFVIYEKIKSKLRERKELQGLDSDTKGGVDFLEFMAAGAVSKSTATIIAYPHGTFLSEIYPCCKSKLPNCVCIL